MTPGEPRLGAWLVEEDRARFCLWAPNHPRVRLRLELQPSPLAPLPSKAESTLRIIDMQPVDCGYHVAEVAGVSPGTLYQYELEDSLIRPDPASRWQPQGVHGPSAVVDPHFGWRDQHWHGLPLEKCVIYELHVGTFTSDSTFDAVIPRFNCLRDLGVTAIELMPIAQFPGERNWGYDGVYPYAAQHSYGGPNGLRRLVDAAHTHGIAVILDVVYNHLGPEGNYLRDFGPYFTDRYSTPWGPALNFDGPQSDHVRRFFIQSAIYYIADCHIDALRVDAVHAIADTSAVPFVQDLVDAVHEAGRILNRQVHIIAESAANDARVVRSRELGGIGFDAQWNDDFHHALHTVLTGERDGYYQPFGSVAHVAKAIREGFVQSGEYSTFHQRRHGSSSRDIPPSRFVVFAQNHDQVGNRMLGERLSALVSPAHLALAAGVVLLSPCIPLLFMGEEYGETNPFLYFISHSDEQLVEAVRKGRGEEFAAFGWKGEPPDPQAIETFRRCILKWDRRETSPYRELLALHRGLLSLRREVPALARLDKATMDVRHDERTRTITVHRWHGSSHVLAAFNFSNRDVTVECHVPRGEWRLRLDSSDVVKGAAGKHTPAEPGANGRRDLAASVASVSFQLFLCDQY